MEAMKAVVKILSLLVSLSPAYFLFQKNGVVIAAAYFIIISILHSIYDRCLGANERLDVLYAQVRGTHQLFDKIDDLSDKIEDLKDEVRNLK